MGTLRSRGRRAVRGGVGFAEFYTAHAPRVRGLARRRLADRALVEDVVQETMIRAYRQGVHQDVDQDPWPWLATVARNLCHDTFRSRRRWVPVDDGAGALETTATAAGSDPEAEFLASARRERVVAALAEVTPRQRMLLTRHHMDGTACTTLATEDGTTVEAVKAALARARLALRARFDERPAVLPVFLAHLISRWRTVGAAVTSWLGGEGALRAAVAGAMAALLALALPPASSAPAAGPSGEEMEVTEPLPAVAGPIPWPATRGVQSDSSPPPDPGSTGRPPEPIPISNPARSATSPSAESDEGVASSDPSGVADVVAVPVPVPLPPIGAPEAPTSVLAETAERVLGDVMHGASASGVGDGIGLLTQPVTPVGF